MKKNKIIPSVDEQLKSLKKTDDKDIDFSDIPKLDKNFFKDAVLFNKPKKESVTIRYDRDILEFFKQEGRGWQTKMNAVLKTYVQAQKN